jgi:nucleoside-diphosphate-sugar epimerase
MSERASRSGVVLITGASGFIGQALCRALGDRKQRVRAVVRREGACGTLQAVHSGLEEVVIEDFLRPINWGPLLQGVNYVVHLAARVHFAGRVAHASESFRAVNVTTTEHLARAATEAGVRRMVFLSSVKVNGEQTSVAPFRESDTPAPEDAYACSKWEAERALALVVQETGLSVTVLRPPLVYGPGVKANFLALIRLVASGVPLPLASIGNRRSLIYVGNLVDAIIRAIETSHTGIRTYLASDGVPISTPALCRKLAASMDCASRLFPFPPSLLELVPPLRKLTRSLEIDDSMIRRDLTWTPPFTLDEAILETAKGYLEEVRSTPG